MDSFKYPSILSDIDISLERGTELADPFNLLGVKSIKLDPQFNALFEDIDLENLYNETTSRYTLNDYCCRCCRSADRQSVILSY